MYTEEQNKEIKKVMEVFSEYIKHVPYFDVLWSDKVGYIFLDGISRNKDEIGVAPLVLRDGEALCNEIFYNLACDILEERGKLHDLCQCNKEEQEAVKEKLSIYLQQLPEYAYLVEKLFEKK